MVVLSQGGFCVAYLVFIGTNLASIFAAAGGGAGGAGLSKTHVIFLALPAQILLSWVRSLTRLAPFSIFADVVNVLAMAVIVADDAEALQGFKHAHAYKGLASVPFVVGVAIYAFEGISMTLLLEASMKDGRKFGSVLGLAMASITLLYGGFAIRLPRIWDDTKEIVTLNLPQHWTTDAVKIGLCIGLVFTFPGKSSAFACPLLLKLAGTLPLAVVLMMFPVHEIFESRVSSSTWYELHIQPRARLRKAVQKGLRVAVVLVASWTADAVPSFGTFISLVGSSVCSLLAFVLPALFHLHLLWHSMNRIEATADYLLIFFGLLFGVWGTYDSLRHFNGPRTSQLHS
eukprot:SM000070S21355  [mRNA]  locus=s70:502901:504880:+ [translate_table: standard]